jgi:hypothetical protein
VDTFFGDGNFAGLGDLDRLDGAVARLSLDLLNLLDDIVTLEDLAEDDMAAIEPTAIRVC